MISSVYERRRHPPDALRDVGTGRWVDRHELLTTADDGTRAIALSVSADPGRRAAVFQLVVIGLDPKPVVLVEQAIPLPVDRWELRASGIWADHVCETPLEHWSYGLEAFALVVDDGRELLDRGYGHRVPLGWEIEFVGDADRVVSAQPLSERAGGYTQPGRVDGELLSATGSHPFTGPALRRHRWGFALQDASPDVLEMDSVLASTAEPVALPGPDGIWWVTATERGLSTRWHYPSKDGD